MMAVIIMTIRTGAFVMIYWVSHSIRPKRALFRVVFLFALAVNKVTCTVHKKLCGQHSTFVRSTNDSATYSTRHTQTDTQRERERETPKQIKKHIHGING